MFSPVIITEAILLTLSEMSRQLPSSAKNIDLDMHFCRICAYRQVKKGEVH